MKHLTAALVLTLPLVALSGCGHGDTDNEANVAPPPAVVVVAPVRRQTIPITEEYEGTIGAVEQVDVRARVQGTLDSAPFKEGDLVHKGDLVFRVQQSEYVAALRSAQAQVATARAQVQQAKGNVFAKQAALTRASITVARDRPLAAEKAIPQKELDNAVQVAEAAKGDLAATRAQVEAANAAVLAAQAAVDNAQLNLGYTTIYAPITGLIGFLNYDVGNVVGGPNTQVLVTITAIDPVKVTFGLDEQTYLALSRNRGTSNADSLRAQELRVVLANGATYGYPGQIYTINPTVDPKTGTIAVEARFPNPDGLLRPGGFARVRLKTENRPNALLIPQTAVIKTQGVDGVYVVDSKNKVSLRSVKLGPQYQQSVVVLDGLRAGERVVVEGVQKAKPGETVVAKSA